MWKKIHRHPKSAYRSATAGAADGTVLHGDSAYRGAIHGMTPGITTLGTIHPGIGGGEVGTTPGITTHGTVRTMAGDILGTEALGAPADGMIHGTITTIAPEAAYRRLIARQDVIPQALR